MDSHQPADPWEIPAAPVDEAEPAESPDTGSVLVEDDVPPEPENPAPLAADRAVEPPPAPEAAEPVIDPPADEALPHEVPTEADPADPEPETVEVEAAEVTDDVVDADGADDPTGEATAEPQPEPQPEPAPPRFDLGLDEEPAEPWGGEGAAFESGTAFDLVRPAPDEDPEPEYEVSEPELSETFVASAGSGRPDLSTPHLTDPAPMFSVADDQLDTVAEAAEPPEPPPAEESSGFRLPGLSVFGRRKAAEAAPTEEADEPPAEVGEAVSLSDEEADLDDVEAPPVPSAWADSPPVGASDPGSPFVESPGDPFAADAPTTDESASVVESADEETEPVTEAEPVAEATEPATESEPEPVPEPVAIEPEPVTVVEEVEPMEPTVATEPPNEEPAAMVPPAARGPVFDEDHPAIELTEPDLTEVLDAPELYVTETAAPEDRPPALLTVDSVPGATIAQAVDVVTAVASAANEREIAEALDRTMAQLRDRASDLGGEAVISVHTEVQEIGGGFLVIASGTAVTLA